MNSWYILGVEDILRVHLKDRMLKTELTRTDDDLDLQVVFTGFWETRFFFHDLDTVDGCFNMHDVPFFHDLAVDLGSWPLHMEITTFTFTIWERERERREDKSYTQSAASPVLPFNSLWVSSFVLVSLVIGRNNAADALDLSGNSASI